MLFIGLILFGMPVGAAAQLILGKRGHIDWPTAFASGIAGSFVGGLLISLIAGDGVTAELYKAHGIVVCGESDVEKL